MAVWIHATLRPSGEMRKSRASCDRSRSSAVQARGLAFAHFECVESAFCAAIDRGCEIPDGLVVGEDAKLDAQRFERTENGVVLITKQMLARL